MGMAPLSYALWMETMNVAPSDPKWPARDRFVLSSGHASALNYTLLHLCGFGLTMEDMKSFRQWGSRTPGHPEYGRTPGVETTTGPLGQGVANAPSSTGPASRWPITGPMPSAATAACRRASPPRPAPWPVR